MKRRWVGFACLSAAVVLSATACSCSRDTSNEDADGGARDGSTATDGAAPDAPVVCEGLDLDNDGAIDARCVGGTDCNDDNPEIAPTRTEVCATSVDEDCDGSVDEQDCAAATGASCDNPTVFNTSTTRVLQLHPVEGAAPPLCVETPFRDGVSSHHIRIDLAEPSAVRISALVSGASGPFGPSLALVASCGGAITTCAASAIDDPIEPGVVLTLPSLSAGSHWIDLGVPAGAEERVIPSYVTVQITPPATTPANDQCANAIVVPATGARYTGVDLAAAGDHAETDCRAQRNGEPIEDVDRDVFYSITTTEVRDLRVAMTSRSQFSAYALEIRRGTCASSDAVRCVPSLVDTWGSLTEAPEVRLRSLAAGTYLIRIEGPPHGLFDLDIEVLEPTVAAPGEDCSDPVMLTPNTPLNDTLVGRSIDFLDFRCGVRPEARPGDTVYYFDVGVTSDIEVIVRSSGGMFAAATIQTSCSDPASAIGYCSELLNSVDDRTQPVGLRARALAVAPGRYYAIVSARSTGAYTVELRTRPAVAKVAVSGNENCSTAYLVPPTGGIFTGTLGADDMGSCRDFGGEPTPDSLFRIEVAQRSTLRALAYEETGSIGLGSAVLLDAACNPDLPACESTAVVDPGTYYILVQGLAGPPDPRDPVPAPIAYELSVEVEPMQ